MQDYLMSIAGQASASSDETWHSILNPSTGAAYARVPIATQTDVQRAFEAATEAFGIWSRTPLPERLAAVHAFADRLERDRQGLTAAEVTDVGKLARVVDAEFAAAITGVRTIARLMNELADLPDGSDGGAARVVWEPRGVLAHVIPWNAPLLASIRRIAVTLATGNTAVIKPSTLAPVTPLLLAEIVASLEVPAGAVNVVTGPGPTVGHWVLDSSSAAMVSLTGSPATGKIALELLGRKLVPATVELGGKSPQIVFPDSPWREAVEAVLNGFTRHAGQVCTCGTRLLVHESIHDAFVDAVVERAAGLRVGDAHEATSQMGPLISAEQRERVTGFVERSRTIGRHIATGGEAGAGEGFYYRPTVAVGVRPEDELFLEEVFGPVLSVTTFKDVAEAVHLANATSYGLAAAVWTSDAARAEDVVRSVDAGAVWVNCYWPGRVDLSWEGRKESGIGPLEFGIEALRDVMVPKQVVVAGSAVPAWW
jgi:betaine-aldehyde dehydrogenase